MTDRGVRTLLSNLSVDDAGMAFDASPEDGSRVFDVLLDGRRIWSFRVDDASPATTGASPATGGRRRLAWPRPFVPYLSGSATFGVRPVDGAPDRLEAAARLGEGDGPIRFEDRHGTGLVINKFGGIGRALADYDPGMLQRLLDNLEQVREAHAERTDHGVYVMGRKLLVS